MPILLDEINPSASYDADEIAAMLACHRTTVHNSIFPHVRTQKVGRRIRTTGGQLIQYLGGDIKPAAHPVCERGSAEGEV